MSHWTGDADSRLYREVLSRCLPAGRTLRDEASRQIDTERLKLVYLEMLGARRARISCSILS